LQVSVDSTVPDAPQTSSVELLHVAVFGVQSLHRLATASHPFPQGSVS